MWERSVLHFFDQYFFRLCFLDRKEGLIFHFLPSLSYRLLVDAKIYEFKKQGDKDGLEPSCKYVIYPDSDEQRLNDPNEPVLSSAK